MARDRLETVVDKENRAPSIFKKATKALACGLTLALLVSPLLPKKLSAEMLYNESHPVQMYRTASPKSEKIDATNVRVRVDTVKKDQNRYDVYFSVFTKNYDLRMPEIGYYDFINGTYSKLCIAYSDNLTINPYKIKQRSHQVFKRDAHDKDMHCEWGTLAGYGPEMPLPRFVKDAIKVYDTLTFFLKPKNEDIKALAENYHLMEVPFYPADRQESARMIVIPVKVEGKGDSEIKFLSNISLKRVCEPNEEIGSKKLCIDINLK